MSIDLNREAGHQAVGQVQERLQERLQELDIECNEEAFQCWRRRQAVSS